MEVQVRNGPIVGEYKVHSLVRSEEVSTDNIGTSYLDQRDNT